MIIELTIPDKRLMVSEYENPKYTINVVNQGIAVSTMILWPHVSSQP